MIEHSFCNTIACWCSLLIYDVSLLWHCAFSFYSFTVDLFILLMSLPPVTLLLCPPVYALFSSACSRKILESMEDGSDCDIISWLVAPAASQNSTSCSPQPLQNLWKNITKQKHVFSAYPKCTSSFYSTEPSIPLNFFSIFFFFLLTFPNIDPSQEPI